MPKQTFNKNEEVGEKRSYPSFRALLLERAASAPIYNPICQQLKRQLIKKGNIDRNYVEKIKGAFSKEERQVRREGLFSLRMNYKDYSEQIIAEVEELTRVYSLLIELLLSLDNPFDQVLLGRIHEWTIYDYREQLRHSSTGRLRLPVFLEEISQRILQGEFPISPDLEEHQTRLTFFFGKTIPPEFFDHDLWDELNFKTFFEAWFDSESCKYEYLFKRFLCGPTKKISFNPFDYYKSDLSTMWELIPLIVAQAKLDSGLQNPDELFLRAVELFENNSYTTPWGDVDIQEPLIILGCLATEAKEELVVPFFTEPLDTFYDSIDEWPPYDWGEKAFELDRSYYERNTMIWALGLLDTPAVLPTLKKALEKDLHTCEMAVWSLVQLGTEESIRLVRQARYGFIGAIDGDWDQNPSLERAAAEALEQAKLPLDDPKLLVDSFMKEPLYKVLEYRLTPFKWLNQTPVEELCPLFFDWFQQSTEESVRLRAVIFMLILCNRKNPYRPLYEVLKASPSLQEAVKEELSQGEWSDYDYYYDVLVENGELVFMSYFSEELEA
ncbi:MAG: hypothetical protein GF308_03285 [Candidatus Heimdallarchaeota archaeon]|nr:hypothetical protein [Candidatus Heimdallarchaeota archaeon]